MKNESFDSSGSENVSLYNLCLFCLLGDSLDDIFVVSTDAILILRKILIELIIEKTMSTN